MEKEIKAEKFDLESLIDYVAQYYEMAMKSYRNSQMTIERNMTI